ncbi:MAG: ABC transporter ATP-binding protein [Acidothermus sp.]|nr:ABC transporter ATP-binding protein [Acidothermus sp.]
MTALLSDPRERAEVSGRDVVVDDFRPVLDAALVIRRGDFVVDAHLQVDGGEVVAVLGPNGAGKSTLLQAIAGLQRIERGRLRVDGHVLDDGGLRFVDPARRPVGYVPQDYVLFPSMSVLDNVAFPLRASGVPKARARRHASELLSRFDLADLARRRPGDLSGGQAQRVAVLRALARGPRILLLDEPFAALDAATRMSTRTQLRAMVAAFDGATVLVTHDPIDAFVLASEIVILEKGTVVQRGTLKDVAAHPRSEYVARLCGLSLFTATSDGNHVVLDDGTVWRVVAAPRGPVFVAVRPTAVSVFPRPQVGSPRNSWNARVISVEQHAAVVRLAMSRPPGLIVDVTIDAVAELHLREGEEVWLSVKATDLVVYPA